MNLNLIRPKYKTEDLLLSITKNCETLIKQTHRKPEETLEFETNTPRQIFRFIPSIPIEGSWMIRLTSLKVYNSFFNITEEFNKFEIYTDTFDEFSFLELKDELQEILDISNITDDHLEDEIKGPRIIKTFKKLESEKRQTDGYILFLMGYARSPFRHFESYLRIVVVWMKMIFN